MRKTIYTEPLPLFTDQGIEDTFAKGRKWVQYNYLSWPYGYTLYYRIRTEDGSDFMDFFFIPSDVSDEGEPPLF